MELKLFIIAVALAFILVAVSGQQGCQEWGECYTDADCVKIQLTCCPCNMGGTEQCVPKTLAPLYQEKLKSCPPEEERICYGINNCEVKSCSCSKGRCIEKK